MAGLLRALSTRLLRRLPSNRANPDSASDIHRKESAARGQGAVELLVLLQEPARILSLCQAMSEWLGTRSIATFRRPLTT